MDAGHEIVEIASTSGGSIVGLAVACAMPQSDLHQLAVLEPMNDLLSRSYVRAVWCGQEDSGAALYKWLDKAFGYRMMKQAKIPIKVFSVDLAKGLFAFTPTTTPDVSMALAARASSAVPKIWDPVEWNGSYFVDGGVRANIPIDYLTRDGLPLLGIKVMEADVYDVSTRLARDEACLAHMLASNEEHEMLLGQALGATLLKVDAGKAGFLDFSLPTATRSALFQAGYEQTKATRF